MSELPAGWAEARAADVCDLVQSGGTPKKDGFVDEGGVPFLKVYNLVGQKIAFNYKPQFISKDAHAGNGKKSQVIPGDVLMNIVGPPLGKVAIVPDDYPEWNCNQALTIFRPSDAVTTDWLYHFLRSGIPVSTVVGETRGVVGQVNISLSQCRDFSVPIPPRPEQRRIVAKLDRLSARSKAAHDHLARVQSLATRAKQATLAAAFRGDLTEEWRSKKGAMSANTTKLNDLCKSLTDGDHQAPPKAESGVPFITISAINDGVLRLEKATRFVPESYCDGLKASRRAERGDILFSVTGSLGIPALVDIDEPFVFQRHIAILKPDTEKTRALYLFHILRAPAVTARAFEEATGVAQLTLSLGKLRAFDIPTPSLDEQDEIVRRIEAAFARIDRMVEDATRAAHLLDRLDQRLLAKAFRGELVPQDPSDEPAAELLARIKAARDAAPNPRRGRRQRA